MHTISNKAITCKLIARISVMTISNTLHNRSIIECNHKIRKCITSIAHHILECNTVDSQKIRQNFTTLVLSGRKIRNKLIQITVLSNFYRLLQSCQIFRDSLCCYCLLTRTLYS